MVCIVDFVFSSSDDRGRLNKSLNVGFKVDLSSKFYSIICYFQNKYWEMLIVWFRAFKTMYTKVHL